METGRIRSRSVVLLLGGAVVLLLVAAVPLALLAHEPASLGLVALDLLFAAVGLVVASRQPANSIGWILIAVALGAVLGSDGAFWALRAYHLDHHGLPLSRFAVALAPLAWASILLLLPLPIMLFPDGRVPRGRWRSPFWGYVTVASVFAVSLLWDDVDAFTKRTIAVDSNGQLTTMGGSQHGAAAVVNIVGIVAYVAFFLAAAARQLLRYRRSVGVERQQLKWLLSGGTVSVFGLLIAAQASNSSPLSALFVAVVALPLSMGVAILRYRLYEIDRLISRTISYALLTGVLVGAFVGLVLLTTHVLPFSSPVGVAASTLAAAALFDPLRKRVQRLVDRRFNRARYDAEVILAGFSGRIRDEVELDAIREQLLAAAVVSLAPTHASIWIRPSLEAPPDVA